MQTLATCDFRDEFELSEREKIEPGMVMVLDENHPGHLRISTQAYDTKVAGIVSGAKGMKPGVLLGGEPRSDEATERRRDEGETQKHRNAEDGSEPLHSCSAQPADAGTARGVDTPVRGNDDLPIALSGRVYCYVDATENAVAVGDLLTTSDTPGCAMKVTDFARSQGAVLGKAMEPLERGKKGLILVLVGLQ